MLELRVGFSRNEYVFSERDGQTAVEIILAGETANELNLMARGGRICYKLNP